MRPFVSSNAGLDWLDAAADAPAVGDRIHGAVSILASDRTGAIERYTVGLGLIARAAEWSRRNAAGEVR